jgi:hypothetical protein
MNRYLEKMQTFARRRRRPCSFGAAIRLAAVVPLVSLLYGPGMASAIPVTPVDLGTTASYGVLAGSFPLEFPTISLGEVLMRPTTMMFGNLMARTSRNPTRDR